MPAPYVTPAYLLAAPTGVDWTNIGLEQPTDEQLAAEQLAMCYRASSQVDAWCSQQLYATINVENEQGPSRFLTINTQGQARLQLKRWPVLQVLQVQVALAINLSFSTVATGNFYIENTINGYSNTTGFGSSGDGPDALIIQPGYVVGGRGSAYGFIVSATYVNGWPHTTLTESCDSGATSLTVGDITGSVGQAMTLHDTEDATTETVIVQSATPASGTTITGPGTLTLVNPTQNAHSGGPNMTGTMISALPPAVMLATINYAKAEMVDAGVAVVGAQSLVQSGNSVNSGASVSAGRLRSEAELMLSRYRQVVK